MLRSACTACRSLLLSTTVDEAAGSVGLQYAACSFVKAVTSRNPHLAFAAGQRTATAAAGGTGIVIDESAVRRLKELQAETPDQPVMLRVEVEGGGCSGFQYKFRLDHNKAQDDLVFEQDGVRVVCDTVSMDFLKGAVVEFEDSLMRSAFQISANPNAESACGCGTSFAAKF